MSNRWNLELMGHGKRERITLIYKIFVQIVDMDEFLANS